MSHISGELDVIVVADLLDLDRSVIRPEPFAHLNLPGLIEHLAHRWLVVHLRY